MSTANNRENISVWENKHNGHLNDLGLSFPIHHKYFLQWPILLLMPSLICSNTHTYSLSLSVSLLSCSLPTTLLSVFNPVVSNNHDHSINAFHKELFSFLKVVPTWNIIKRKNKSWHLKLYINHNLMYSLHSSCRKCYQLILNTSWVYPALPGSLY